MESFLPQANVTYDNLPITSLSEKSCPCLKFSISCNHLKVKKVFIPQKKRRVFSWLDCSNSDNSWNFAEGETD